MTRLKIAVLIVVPTDLQRPKGGVEAVAVSLVRGLAQIPDLEVHVVTQSPIAKQNIFAVWPGVIIHLLPRPTKPLLSFAVGAGRRQVHALLRRLQPDVIHAHDTFGIMVKGYPAPRVFTVHGFIHEDTRYDRGRFSWLRSKLWQQVETSAWADQPHIISISPYVRERLRGITKAVVHDIENPIAYECFTVKRNEKPETIFCAATLCKRKNTLGLVKAFHQLSDKHPQARLRWAGSSDDPSYQRLVEDYINANGLAEKVDFLGSIPSDQMRDELSVASVFALVSFEEGAPMGIAEAMAAGVPIVTSNRCGMPYMVRDEEGGFLVDPSDPGDISGRLSQLLANETLRQKMGATSRRVAEERFHPSCVAERTWRVYQRAWRRFHKEK